MELNTTHSTHTLNVLAEQNGHSVLLMSWNSIIVNINGVAVFATDSRNNSRDAVNTKFPKTEDVWSERPPLLCSYIVFYPLKPQEFLNMPWSSLCVGRAGRPFEIIRLSPQEYELFQSAQRGEKPINAQLEIFPIHHSAVAGIG